MERGQERQEKEDKRDNEGEAYPFDTKKPPEFSQPK
jgi:hypothetical protein